VPDHSAALGDGGAVRRMAAFAGCTLYLPQPSATVVRGARNLESSGYDMMRPLPLAACLALAAFSLAAFAQSQTPPAAEAAAAPVSAPAAQPLVGNPKNGHLLTYTCQGCHGIAGYKNAYPNYHVPRIGGQSAEYLASALTEYKNGNRKHPTMQAQAQSFSEQDIADIAAFLSTVK
jgi:cytochrome c553